jgi:hypothetical protein
LASRTDLFVSIYILSVHSKSINGAKFAATMTDFAICLAIPDSENNNRRGGI